MDGHNNFVFYGSWMDTIEGYRQDFGDEYADEIIVNIVYYGTTGKILSDKKSIIGYIKGSVAPNIDSAKSKYEKAQAGGAKGGKQKLIGDKENVKIALLKLQGTTRKEIASIMGVSESTIKRSEGWISPDRFKTGQEVSSGRPVNQQVDIDKDIDIEKERKKETDSFGPFGEETGETGFLPENTAQNLDKDIDKEIDKEKEREIEMGSLSLSEKLARDFNRPKEWVDIGLGMKSEEEWAKYGYGLFKKESFIEQVDIQYAKIMEARREAKKNAEIIRRQREERIVIPIQGPISKPKKKKEIDLNTLV